MDLHDQIDVVARHITDVPADLDVSRRVFRRLPMRRRGPRLQPVAVTCGVVLVVGLALWMRSQPQDTRVSQQTSATPRAAASSVSVPEAAGGRRAARPTPTPPASSALVSASARPLPAIAPIEIEPMARPAPIVVPSLEIRPIVVEPVSVAPLQAGAGL